MFLSKKIAKLRKNSTIQTEKPSQKILSTDPKKKSSKCRFEEIPQHSKFIYPEPVYRIYGDLVFMKYKGSLQTEMSLLNKFKSLQNITINKIFHQKAVTIKLDQKIEQETPAWTEIVYQLAQSGDQEMIGWARIIKNFCQTYSKVMQFNSGKRQSRKKMKSEPRKKFFSQVTEETESLREKLFASFPCLQLKFRLKNHQNQLKEMIFSEDFIKELGHSMESFVTSVVKEGVPQMMPYENPLGNMILKTLLENYFTIGERGYEVSEVETTLLIKNNFAKTIKFKTYFLMNYETNTFGMDIILALTESREPYIIPKNSFDQLLNLDFIEMMSVEEREKNYFLSTYYNYLIQRIYTNIDKTCSVKELNSADDESTINLKCEEIPVSDIKCVTFVL